MSGRGNTSVATGSGPASVAVPVCVAGAGGHGRELLGVVRACAPRVRFAGFLDDSEPDDALLGRIRAAYLGGIDAATLAAVADRDPEARLALGIGSAAGRRAVDAAVGGALPYAELVHPAALLDEDVEWGEGVAIFGLATVTTHIRLGRHVHVGRGAAVGHDCVVGDFVTVMPLAAVSGNVRIGDGATIGAGAVVRQGQVIGAGAYVGAGAVVVDDVPDGVTVVGNPARPLRR